MTSNEKSFINYIKKNRVEQYDTGNDNIFNLTFIKNFYNKTIKLNSDNFFGEKMNNDFIICLAYIKFNKIKYGTSYRDKIEKIISSIDSA